MSESHSRQAGLEYGLRRGIDGLFTAAIVVALIMLLGDYNQQQSFVALIPLLGFIAGSIYGLVRVWRS